MDLKDREIMVEIRDLLRSIDRRLEANGSVCFDKKRDDDGRGN